MADNKTQVDLSDPKVDKPADNSDFHDKLEAAIEPNLKTEQAAKITMIDKRIFFITILLVFYVISNVNILRASFISAYI